MSKLFKTLAFGAVLVASPAAANHIFHLDEPFASRGACEAETASLSNDDAPMRNQGGVIHREPNVSLMMTR